MKKQPGKTPTKTLRDAYQVCGFHVQARIDSYDELDHPAFVITLDRRSKNVWRAPFASGFYTVV